MFRAPFVTPESLALGRASQLAQENAYRLFAICETKWPSEMDFSFVEEEARDAFVLLSIHLRRTGQIWGFEDRDWPKVKHFSSRNPGNLIEKPLTSVLGVGAHLSRFKLYVGIKDDRYCIGDINAGTPERTIQINPASLVTECLSVLQSCTREAFEQRTLSAANDFTAQNQSNTKGN